MIAVAAAGPRGEKQDGWVGVVAAAGRGGGGVGAASGMGAKEGRELTNESEMARRK